MCIVPIWTISNYDIRFLYKMLDTILTILTPRVLISIRAAKDGCFVYPKLWFSYVIRHNGVGFLEEIRRGIKIFKCKQT